MYQYPHGRQASDAKVAHILSAYRPEKLAKSLMHKYGSAPAFVQATSEGAATESPSQSQSKLEPALQERKDELMSFYRGMLHEQVAKCDDLLTKFTFQEVVKSLQKKYGKLPEGWEASQAQKPEHAVAVEQLQAFYTAENAERVGKIDEILTKHKFKDVVASIKKKYGAVPPGWEAHLPKSGWFGFG